MEEKLVYTVEEAGKVLGIGRNKAYELARSGKMPVVPIGRQLRVPHQALMDWLNKEAAKALQNGEDRQEQDRERISQAVGKMAGKKR